MESQRGERKRREVRRESAAGGGGPPRWASVAGNGGLLTLPRTWRVPRRVVVVVFVFVFVVVVVVVIVVVVVVVVVFVVCIAVVGPLPLLYLPFSDLVNQISPPRRRWGDDGNAVRNVGSAVQ